MASLVLAGETIYNLPYNLRRDYQKVMLDVLRVSNTQLGLLSSILGVLALICYFPGGWLADRVSPRRLLAFSLATTGVSGFYLLRRPEYSHLVALFAFWGISTILTFWAALIKATRAWGGKDEQGRAFGILDGGRGVVSAAMGSIGVGLFSHAGGASAGLSAVIVMHSVGALIAALAVWRFVGDDRGAVVHEERPGGLEQLKGTAKLPAVWLQAFVILCAYCAYWGTFDLSSFAVDAYGATATAGAKLSTFGVWMRPVACIGAGFIADRVGASRVVAVGFALSAASFGAFGLLPIDPAARWMLWGNTAVLCAAVYSLRGVYFALLEEARLPMELTGTAVGLASMLGYTPDIFSPLVSGALIDRYPGRRGHQLLFSGMAVVSLLGWVAAAVMRRLSIAAAELRA